MQRTEHRSTACLMVDRNRSAGHFDEGIFHFRQAVQIWREVVLYLPQSLLDMVISIQKYVRFFERVNCFRADYLL